MVIFEDKHKKRYIVPDIIRYIESDLMSIKETKIQYDLVIPGSLYNELKSTAKKLDTTMAVVLRFCLDEKLKEIKSGNVKLKVKEKRIEKVIEV